MYAKTAHSIMDHGFELILYCRLFYLQLPLKLADT